MDLNELRNKIDGIDKELVKLFKERMETAAEVGRFKQKNGVPVSDSVRESEILNNVSNNVPEELQGYTETLYRTIFELSRSYQKEIISQSNHTEG